VDGSSRKPSVFGPDARGERRERVLASPRFGDGKFRNTHGILPGLKGNPLPTLGEYFFGGGERIPKVPLPVLDPRAGWAAPIETELRVTWLGHSTLLLESAGVRVLTDPVFGDRASPLSFAGPRRFHATPVSIEQLPPLDAVLVSHDHYDHLCRASIQALLARDVPFITALGVGARLEAFGVPVERIVELDWWESWQSPAAGLRFTAAPAQHFSGRALHDRNHTLWASWVIETERSKVFFSGDSGLTDEFQQIGAQLGPFDLVMLEIGAWHPSWGDIHLGPTNALEAFTWLRGKALLPVHWGTFNLAIHPWDEPAETLWNLAAARGSRLFTPKLGEVLEPARVEIPNAWWRQLRSRSARVGT
jgi:L-ascorbate metabolism protein UlaG (beta-lactamase superfamily)